MAEIERKIAKLKIEKEGGRWSDRPESERERESESERGRERERERERE